MKPANEGRRLSTFHNYGSSSVMGNVYGPVFIININSPESLAGLEAALHRIIAELGADDRVKLLGVQLETVTEQ